MFDKELYIVSRTEVTHFAREDLYRPAAVIF